MTTTMQGERRPDRIRHSWRCRRDAPILETLRRDPTGQARVVAMCQACGGTDLADRIERDRPAELDGRDLGGDAA